MELPGAGHLGRDAAGDDFTESRVIGGVLQVRPIEARTAAAGAGLTVTQGALRFEDFPTHRGVGRLRERGGGEKSENNPTPHR